MTKSSTYAILVILNRQINKNSVEALSKLGANMPVISKTRSCHKILAEIKDRGFATIKLDANLVLRPGDIAVLLNRPFPKADKTLSRWREVPLQ